MAATQDKVTQVNELFDTVLILDFGSQYSHLITRRIREFGVYCELLPCTQKIADLHFIPKGIFDVKAFNTWQGYESVILSGSPYSVYDVDSPHVDTVVFELGVPVLGICYGLQEMANLMGGKVEACDHREYGHAALTITKHVDHPFINLLFEGLEGDIQVWMSHGDQVTQAPPGFRIIATTRTAPFAAVAHEEKHFFGIQFHPEVTHTVDGGTVLRNFVVGICKCKTSWTMEISKMLKDAFIDTEIQRIRTIVGPVGQVVGAVSGGVDSTVAAKLMHEAIGDRYATYVCYCEHCGADTLICCHPATSFHAILVDNGVMRLNECASVKKMLGDKMGINIEVVDASALFLGRLAGVTDPERKRKIIGNTFIEVFEAEAAKIDKKTGGGKIEYLLQGTLYPDVIESISFKGPSATIKTHHNVGGLLEDMKLKLIEPLRELFKDEVRALGTLLGLDDELVWRHPFPGPGIAIRVLGEVTPSQVEIARLADHIYIEEIKRAGYYRQISQAYAALLPVKAVGVMGDARTYEQVIALRAVETKDFMTADVFASAEWFLTLKKISSRIINEVKGVNRVVYDISSKPPATIEWE
ncbi:class I glutamine amidotransferase-like protein [Jimgerdemannia flammicorona]|uniref:GMP synthase [glutamine-hydrolyzing] n=1 Tax=Jimgerdemannia flammicorona TaxID=994334 RepID=A0A433QAF0_9FUNG|nr:class I glutamine amidotransferase-like protein [Jimgerdemannia flammicorona]